MPQVCCKGVGFSHAAQMNFIQQKYITPMAELNSPQLFLIGAKVAEKDHACLVPVGPLLLPPSAGAVGKTFDGIDGIAKWRQNLDVTVATIHRPVSSCCKRYRA